MSKPDLEQVFSSIQKGNDYHDDQKYWEAAKAYTEARSTLLQLSDDQLPPPPQVTENNNDKHVEEERHRVQLLYRQQARDYLHRARESFIAALRSEDEGDRQLTLDTPTIVEKLMKGNDKETCSDRLRVFALLFSNEKILETTTKRIPLEEQESSLEERLRTLTANMPTAAKSTQERLQDLNKGLKGLGVSLPSSTPKTTNSISMELLHSTNNNKSDFEQVQDIISQAKDEVQMEQLYYSSKTNEDGPAETTSSSALLQEDDADALMETMIDAVEAAKNSNEENDSVSDGHDSGTDNDDPSSYNDPFSSSDLAFFQDRVNEAQASLAELNAMLEVEDGEETALLFDADTGKHALDTALRYLQQVQKRWKEAKRKKT
jgi:hypothetical protein